MKLPRKLREDIDVNQNLKMLTQAYQEHAIEQINFARYSVISSREFAEELEEIFFNVKTSYKSFLEALKKKNKHLLQANKKDKEVIVLVTSNNKFYGDIIAKLWHAFYQRIKKTDLTKTDLIIVGRQGRNFIEQSDLPKDYRYLEIPDTNFTLETLKPLIALILPYERVTVFYGKFNNIISQEPIEASLAGDFPEDRKTTEEKKSFLFEPSIEHILTFFETQIFSLLFDQTMHEARLARFASRIKAMEIAQTNLQDQLRKLMQRERKFRSIESNRKQQQMFAGRRLWNKT